MWHNFETDPPPLKEIDLHRQADFLFDIKTRQGHRLVIPVSQYIPSVGPAKVAGWFVYGKNSVIENVFGKVEIIAWMEYPGPNL